ncbi:MAG: DNA primase, partial [Methanosarcinales archaeon]|nr:DNA primase [Methanosarcinales archaeon]
QPKSREIPEPEPELVSEPEPQIVDEFEVAEPEIVEVAEPHPLKSHLDELKGTLNARFVDDNGEVISEFAIRDLKAELENSNGNVKNIVFDGAITQRMVDMTSEKDIECILGLRTESVVKCPANIKILTERDIT